MPNQEIDGVILEILQTSPTQGGACNEIMNFYSQKLDNKMRWLTKPMVIYHQNGERRAFLRLVKENGQSLTVSVRIPV
ncbi:MAG: hypothetical protein COY69_01120 [Candidatus Magasanikbacteria bacterium CG_4_10_14_0_8_um_filter_32_14]|uniref:Uncharacterized protein n=2 Tax=Candidatus Magasanikiibacteriota TaxID=1752731 RepID=A0A2M7R9V3_9BACT|nr:MAG: hypothetical protein AUJ23_00895 [Candidatus Magasanikbacteria bacterium CG1_02_32_51]PIY93533.1 MAG: hypothetical protein COY69_01120 [Candidatus Magasanikbacteria bacterium CG_4_10_14_0_8_um_filter_32_14]